MNNGQSPVGLVWAAARNGTIGVDGGLPWHLPEDLAHFRELTGSCPVVMGRHTWDALPDRFRPLPGRRNIVLTRNAEWVARGAEPASSLNAALALAATGLPETIWVIGGAEVFREAAALASSIEITDVDADFGGDRYAPDTTGWRTVHRDPASGWYESRTGLRYAFRQLAR